MARIDLTNQAVMKDSLDSSIQELETELSGSYAFFKKLPAEKRREMLLSGKYPVIKRAWDHYIYLKKYFGDIPLPKMQELTGLPVTRKEILLEVSK